MPQESVGDVYHLVGLGARTLHLTNYPILTTSDISDAKVQEILIKQYTTVPFKLINTE